jgi:phospholipid transport system substrate-binding protein
MSNPPRLHAARLLGAMMVGFAAAGALGLTPASAAAQVARAHADPSAEAFVQSEVSRAISILGDRGLGEEAKKRAFYDFVNQVGDVPRITNFVLGRYRRQISPAKYQEFADVFRRYADHIYEERLGDYHGENLVVTGSVQHAPGDVVVSTRITGGSYQGDPVVNWRLLQGPQGWKVVDVQAQGVWLAVVEQQDFTSTLANSNGNIDVLISQLRRQVQSDGSRNR